MIRRPNNPGCLNRVPHLLAAFALGLGMPAATAHHDVETVIAGFTTRIEAGEESAELYFERATKYRTLRNPAMAEADLRRAIACDASFSPAHRELARLLSAQGNTDEAIAAANRAIATAPADSDRAAALIILARLRAAANQPGEALRACEDAFLLRAVGEIDWYLLHAELLDALGRVEDCAPVLKAGFTVTHSIVLRDAWIDALLVAGKIDTALPVIERELADSRLKSSWLLRRARARLQSGATASAEQDLHACLRELAPRIHPSRPDLTLIADRGLANALLGRLDAARADLAVAKSAGVDSWVTAPLERVLAAPCPATSSGKP